MTPRKYAALMRRHREAIKFRYVLPIVQFAKFASFWANSRISDPSQYTKPADFIPDLNAETEPTKPVMIGDPVKTSLYIMSMWDAYAASFK